MYQKWFESGERCLSIESRDLPHTATYNLKRMNSFKGKEIVNTVPIRQLSVITTERIPVSVTAFDVTVEVDRLSAAPTGSDQPKMEDRATLIPSL